jgi:hypothetical protein
MQIPTYKISFFENCYSNTANEKELSFDEILIYFRKAARREFIAKEQLEAMICGTLIEGKRTTESLICRTIITYDIDYYKHNLDMLLDYVKECLKDNTYICYSTASSTFEKPRVRILVFVNKTMTAQEYRVVSLNVAKTLFKEFFNSDVGKIDDASYSPCYLMYLPTLREGFKTLKNAGELLDITEYLSLDIKEETTEIQEFVKTAKNTPLSITDDRVREVLAEYDVEDTDRDSWLKVCQGLHHQYKGSEDGYKLFLEWSLTDTRFNEAQIRSDTKTAYYSLKSDRSNPITFASTIAVMNDKKKLLPTKECNDVELVQEMPKNKFVHLKLNAKGFVTKTKSTYENFKIMCNHYGVKLNYDIITKRNVNTFNMTNDNLVAGTLGSLMVLNDMEREAAHIYSEMLAHDNTINSFKDVLDSITWDGKSRLREFYDTVIIDDEFKEIRDTYLLKWLQQMLYLTTYEGVRKVARQILVFQGLQDGGKSTWLMNLMPAHLRENYIGEGLLLTGNHTEQRALLSYVFVELAELEQSFKHTDINAFKAFFGRTKDELNLKFAKYTVRYPRNTSFLGTINEKTFLKDKTGSTRFLVLPAKKLNGYHDIDMLHLYKEILETTDYVNFELNQEDKLKQKLINEEFEQPNLLEETFLDNFELEFDNDGQYMNCSEMLNQLSLGVRDFTYSRKADIKHIVDKYGFKYRKDLKKWLVKIKQGDN